MFKTKLEKWVCLIIILCLLFFFLLNKNLQEDIIMNKNYILTNIDINVDSLFNRFDYTMVVLFSEKDCGSCLEILNPVNEIYNNHNQNKMNLKVFGLFQNNSKNNKMRNFINELYLNFPIYEIKDKKIFKKLQTPVVLLFDKKGSLKYIRTSTTSKGEYMIFYNVIELIV